MIESLFNGIQQVSTNLEEMRKAQSDYLLKAVNSQFEMQKRHCELSAQILENHIEYYTTWLTDLQESVSRHSVHQFTSLVRDKQEKPKKAA
jgi:hypothetical protein